MTNRPDHEDDHDRTTEEWIDESMAEGDIANGEGDPERTPKHTDANDR